MPGRLAIGTIAVVLAATGIATALERTASAPPPTAAQVVRARQASYELSVITFSQLKRAVETGSDVSKQKFAASALAQWAVALPTLFPEGTGPGETPIETGAKPEIWSNRAAFLARANDYAVATARLADMAKAGDTNGFASQLSVVKKACDSCHADFKTRD